MYKLLFAVCVAVIAVVVAWMGLQPLEKKGLSLRLEPDKVYKVWIGAERQIEPPPEFNEVSRSAWDENKDVDFCINPDPDDTLRPGKYLRLGSSMSGGFPFRPAYFAYVDTTDIMAVKYHYLKQLYIVAADNISSMLVPLYFDSGLIPLRVAASLVVDPFGTLESGSDTGGLMRRHMSVRTGFIYSRLHMNETDRTVERIMSLYPNKPVAAGASWIVRNDSIAGYQVNEHTEMKVLEQKAGKIILELSSKAGTYGSPLLIDSCGVFMEIEFIASQNGTLEVDEATGLVEDGLIKQKVEGVFRVDSLPDLVLPNEQKFVITGDYIIKLKESKSHQIPSLKTKMPLRGGDTIDIKPVPVDTNVVKPEN